jgi:hypothetical protein
MTKHDHKSLPKPDPCEHDLKLCKECDAVECAKCGDEWVEASSVECQLCRLKRDQAGTLPDKKGWEPYGAILCTGHKGDGGATLASCPN